MVGGISIGYSKRADTVSCQPFSQVVLGSGVLTQLALELLLLTVADGALENLALLAVLRQSEVGLAALAASASRLDGDEHSHCVTPFG